MFIHPSSQSLGPAKALLLSGRLVARKADNGETVGSEILGCRKSGTPRDCASHELCRETQTRLEHSPRRTWLLDKKQTRQGRQTAPLPHARSIRRRNRRGGLHAILSGNRLCGECSPPDFPFPSPRSASFTHFSFAPTNKGRGREPSKPRASYALCGTNATMRFETSTLARNKLAPVPPRSTGGKQRRVIPTSIYPLSLSLRNHPILTSIVDG
jgi:hypothetical protein